MSLHKKTLRIYILILLLILLSDGCRYILMFSSLSGILAYSLTILRNLIIDGLFISWAISIRLRIINTQVRRFLLSIAYLIIFWLIVRTLKYQFFSSTHLGRYCWYLYYVPMLFIPLLILFVSLSVGRPEHFRVKKWGNSLFLISAVLLLMILTNDLHQLAFRFPNGLLYFDSPDHRYGLVYFLALGWIIICSLTALCFLLIRSHVPDSKKRILMPGICMMILAFYFILYDTLPRNTHMIAGDMPAVTCMLIVAALESCIQNGLIQSNTHYNELFHICDIRAVIVDDNYNIRQSTSSVPKLSVDQMKTAEGGAIEINEQNILRSMPLNDGRILWLEDISELKRLQKKIRSNTALLSEEAVLLAKEIRQKEEKAITDVRNHLYDTVTLEITPQITRIDQLISHRDDDPAKRQKALKEMCILGAYIKRRCNLVFLNEQHKMISSMELYNCLQESAEYIIQYGIPCLAEQITQGTVSVENAKTAYDYFEAVTENVLDTLTALSVRIRAPENALILELMAECAGVRPCSKDLSRRIETTGGRIENDYEDGIWYSTLTLPEGGEPL